MIFFKDTATTEIYTLSLHDALPISGGHRGAARPGAVVRGDRLAADPHAVRRAARRLALAGGGAEPCGGAVDGRGSGGRAGRRDRKSTRLNSSHANISYAVFCLKKKQ